MHVCHIVPSLEERHGGPSKSVRALANAQASAGTEVTLLSTAEAGHPAPVPAGDAARVSVFPRVFPRSVCRSPGLESALFAGQADCFHHHSLWLLTLRYAHNAARRSGTPLVVSPRGMLSPWAYRHRRIRKALASLLIHPRALAGAAGWHATSEEEADDIRRLGFRQPVCVAPNGVSVPAPAELAADRETWLRAHPSLAGRRVALFYSRFHRKKRVRELMALWAARPRGTWTLLVAGIPEEESVAELRQLAGGPDIVVADSTGMPAPYGLAELFLLPSHSENFGLVIAEALAAGVPALVTDTTPWRQLDSRHAGRCVGWESYAAALAVMLELPPNDLAALGAAGRAWISQDFAWPQAATRLLDFYRSLNHG